MPVAIPHPAATLTLVRDGPEGLEVLMLRRSPGLAFMPGVHVFPGGALDPGDNAPEVQSCCAGLEDAAASRALGVERGGLAYWIAAIREAFEEAGILLAYDAAGAMVQLDGEVGGRFRDHRRALEARRGDFAAWVRGEGLRLAVDRLHYFSHWITPESLPRRYDTRFFLAVAPERQEVMHDNHEIVAHAWLRPRDALDLSAREAISLRLPTLRTLEQVAACSTTAELIAGIAPASRIPALQPRITADGRSVLPGEPGYEEG